MLQNGFFASSLGKARTVSPVFPLCTALIGLWAAPAMAMPASAALGELHQDMQRCAQIQADPARLACYDKLTVSWAARPAMPAPQPPLSPQESFGRETVARKAVDTRAEPVALAELSTVIREVYQDASGKGMFVLENEQVWRQTDGGRVRQLRPGAAITLKRGMMGSYRMVPQGSNRVISVTRVR